MTLRGHYQRQRDIFSSNLGNGAGNGNEYGSVVYNTAMDVYYHHMIMGQLTTEQAKVILANQFNISSEGLARYPGQWGSGMAYYDQSTFLEQFEDNGGQDEHSQNNNNGTGHDYTTGEYFTPDVGQATRHNLQIPGSIYHYWDGNMDSHDWATHGFSTPIAAGSYKSNDEKIYPRPILDTLGCYAMSISHYIAAYNPNDLTEFYGFRALTAQEAEGGIPAGFPIATVMQMFVKTGYDKQGDDVPKDDWHYQPFRTFEIKPVWRKAYGMKMPASSFFLLEPELGLESFDPKHTDDTWPTLYLPKYLERVTFNDIRETETTGYQGIVGTFKKMPAQGVLDKEFKEGKVWSIYGRVPREKKKTDYACKVEWIGEGGTPNVFSKHPTNLKDCNDEGKTMVIYRFPRQLDPEVDRAELEWNSKHNIPDYSLDNTKYCYPYPRAEADRSGYALIGRLQPGSSDSVGAEKHEVILSNNEVFGGRRAIKLIPMVSASSHEYACYGVGEVWDPGPRAGKGSDRERTMDYWCFDTTSVHGGTISVADPKKKTYFDNSKINHAYFVDKNFQAGSTAFAIGQCILTYDMSSASIDAKLGRVHPSERVIMSLDRMATSYNLEPHTSHERNPRPIHDGSLQGTRKSDFLPPAVTITTDDLKHGYEPAGMATIKDTFKKIYGIDLTPEWFSTVDLGSAQDPNDPTRYIVNTTYGKFSYPYSILGFVIPGYYMGPVLKYDMEGNPVGHTTNYPGYLGNRTSYMIYQSPFGVAMRQTVTFHEEIPTGIEDPFGDKYEDMTREQWEKIQYDDWLKETLIDEHGDTRYTDTPFKQRLHLFNDDYVTGEMLIEKGLPIPGVDTTDYEMPEIDYNPFEPDDTDDTDGLSGFTSHEGFTVTDVTSKWGTLGSAHPRYTGDMGLQAVQPGYDSEAEQLDYMAFNNIDGVLDDLWDGVTDTGKDVAVAVGKGAGVGIGAGFAIAGLGLAGSFLLAGAGKGLGNFVSRALS